MSRCRILAKLRGQGWFRTVTDALDAEGIEWIVIPPPRTGHPKLRLRRPGGEWVERVIPCTPRASSAVHHIVLGQVMDALDRPHAAAAPTITSGWTPERIACLTRGVNPLAGTERCCRL